MLYEPVIGLEVHVQLRTATKMFCRCPNRFGALPNTLVCPTCLGHPGALPSLNRQAVDLAIQLACALGCKIHSRSVFARKNYFYADLPKGYQISQFDLPLAEDGHLPLVRHPRQVRIRRLHLEEDAGKLLHEGAGAQASLVDFNRSGVPLVEIVSEPDLRSPDEAHDCLQALHQVLGYTGASDGNMEEGSLRCDANVSLRPPDTTGLGPRVEIKNLNSFRHVARALEFEIERQTGVLEAGGHVVQETRAFDAAHNVTHVLRSKEDAQDYRYFPEPDLPPLQVSGERVACLAADLPELPWERRQRFLDSYGLRPSDAERLTAEPELAEYFERAAAACPGHAQSLANWIQTEILRERKTRQGRLQDALAAERLAELVTLVEAGVLSTSAGKTVLAALWESDETAAAAAERLGLAQVRNAERLRDWVEAALEEHPVQLADFLAGKEQLLGFFIGQVMRRSGGRAEPHAVRELLQQALGARQTTSP